MSAVGQGALLATLLVALLEEKQTVRLNKHAEANTLLCARDDDNIYLTHRPPAAVALLSYLHEAVAALG